MHEHDVFRLNMLNKLQNSLSVSMGTKRHIFNFHIDFIFFFINDNTIFFQKKQNYNKIYVFTPVSSLFPSVPATQYPGIINVFFLSWHHSLNTWVDSPPCNMPGVAKSTNGCGLLIKFLSNGRIYLKSNILLLF